MSIGCNHANYGLGQFSLVELTSLGMVGTAATISVEGGPSIDKKEIIIEYSKEIIIEYPSRASPSALS